jgi:hypothetical protein
MPQELGPGISGTKTLYSAAWIIWKKTQIFIRRRLSHIFAIGLGLLVVVREQEELGQMWTGSHLNLTRVYIIVTILVSLVMITWRLRHYTLFTPNWQIKAIEALGVATCFLAFVVLFKEHTRIAKTLFHSRLNLIQSLMLLVLLATVFWGIIEGRRNLPSKIDGSPDYEKPPHEPMLAKTLSALIIGTSLIAMVHERSEIHGLLKELKITFWKAGILSLTVGTILAAAWEIFGNKLATSPQEVNFLAAIRLLREQLEALRSAKSAGTLNKEHVDRFAGDFLKLTSETLCGNKKVHACLMQEDTKTQTLKMTAWTEKSDYFAGLEIPIPAEDSDVTGPAGISFVTGKVVYMPLKRWEMRWPMILIRSKNSEWYDPGEVTYGWIRSPDLKMEYFRSVVSVPVTSYDNPESRRVLGVLSYSTRSLDPFADRDFMMAECLSDILAQALILLEQVPRN